MTARPAAAPLAGVLAAFAAIYVIWGSTYLAIRFALETLPPFLMAGVRFLVAGTLLYAWSRWRSGERPSGRHWRSALVIGGLLLMGGNGGVVWAELSVPSGLTALLIACVPLWMVLLDWLRPGGQRPTRPVLVGLAVGLVGVATLVGGSHDVAAGRVPWLPALVLLLASGSWSTGSLYSRSAPLPRSPLLGTAMEMLCGGALLTLAGLATGEVAAVDLAAVSARSALAMLYLVLFGSLVGFTAYVWLLRVTTPARAATYAYVNPVVAVLLGWLLAGEPLNGRVGLAAVLVVGAVALVTVGRRSPRPELRTAVGDAPAAPVAPPALAVAGAVQASPAGSPGRALRDAG